MELQNVTKMIGGYTLGMQVDGRERLVVVIKGTFNIPAPGATASLADEQVELCEGDVFSGEPGFSAAIYESDYAPFKPKCDVLFNGSAYAPKGKSTTKVSVALRVGAMAKGFDVIGPRKWHHFRPSRAEPFTVMPISYDNAYGGSDLSHANPKHHRAFANNPVGLGFHTNLKHDLVEGQPLPNTELRGKSVTKPGGTYPVLAFGPLGRSWPARVKLAGTYDDHWRDNVFPFLPADFNEDYYQAAPVEQQIPYLTGGEEVVLQNLTPEGMTRFQVPNVSVPVAFFYKNGPIVKDQAVADTLVLEPDLGRFSITWRASLPLKKNLFEIETVLAGTKSRAWWRAKETGKDYYPSLGAMVANKNGDVEEVVE